MTSHPFIMFFSNCSAVVTKQKGGEGHGGITPTAGGLCSHPMQCYHQLIIIIELIAVSFVSTKFITYYHIVISCLLGGCCHDRPGCKMPLLNNIGNFYFTLRILMTLNSIPLERRHNVMCLQCRLAF